MHVPKVEAEDCGSRSNLELLPVTVRFMDGDESREGESIVLGVEELSISEDTLISWRRAAENSANRAAEYAAVLALLLGLGFASLLVVVVESNRVILVGAFTPMVVGLAWLYAWAILRRRLIGRAARQMREFLIPALLTRASWEELLRLARRDTAGFTHDSVIIRTERRGTSIYLVATKYDLSKGDWFLPEGFGMGTSGGGAG